MIAGRPAASSCARSNSSRTPCMLTRLKASVTVVSAPTMSNSPARAPHAAPRRCPCRSTRRSALSAGSPDHIASAWYPIDFRAAARLPEAGVAANFMANRSVTGRARRMNQIAMSLH